MNAQYVDVTYLDGSTDLVTVEEAKQLRDDGELLVSANDGSAMTITDLYGAGWPAKWDGMEEAD